MNDRPQTKSDAELFADAMSGGPEAFAPIVERYQDAVFGVALARLRDFHEAEDAAQQALVEAFERLGNLKDPSRLGAWLRSVTIHRCIDRLRARRKVAPVEDDMQASDAPAPHDELERRELRGQVLAAIARLSKTQRETTTLFYINGYSINEVAGIQEVPVGTVKRRLHDARERLKEEMIGMVENVLKSEAPKDDFAARVFELLTLSAAEDHEYTRTWQEIVSELRRIGAEGIDGFIRAFASRRWSTRARAAKVLKRRHAPQKADVAFELLKDALKDPNRKVRRHAVEAILNLNPPDEDTRAEIVALTVPLLADPSARVRRVAWDLCPWAARVPIEPVVRAFLVEKDRWTRACMEYLLRAILRAREGRLDEKNPWRQERVRLR